MASHAPDYRRLAMGCRSHQGPATLVAGDGSEIPADVELHVQRSGHLREWYGTATVEDFDLTSLGDYVLRLPNDREARVIIAGAMLGSGTIQLQGSGVPPFGSE
jgi:hypothetical protein